MATSVFFRVVKAPKHHPFSGLYAVEKVFIKGGAIVQKELVHEWDLRILSEAALARFGGSAAYDSYTFDNGEPEDETGKPEYPVIDARTKEDLKDLTKNKLTRELKLKPSKEESQ
jgi:hypothetical protein